MGLMTLNYPDSLPDALQESRDDFEREARMAMAVKLFERRRIPSGTAAQLAGMDRVSFLLKLHEFGVSPIQVEADELAEDLRNA